MMGVTCGAHVVLKHLLAARIDSAREMLESFGNVPEILGQFATVPLELFVWGVLFSLVCRRPLAAAMLGGLVGASVAALPTAALDRLWLMALPVRLVVVGLVAWIDVWLAGRWFHDDGVLGFPRRPSHKTPLPANESVGSDRPSSTTTTKPTYEFGRLSWQQWRQSRRILAAFGLVALLVAIVSVVLPWLSTNDINGLWFVALVLIPLAGVCVFRGDSQENRVQFLAQCGARPGRVWLTRQLVWFVAATAIMLVFLVPLIIAAGNNRPPDPEAVPAIGFLLGTWWMVSYGCGQFCSIYFRSSILAAMVTLMLLVTVTVCGFVAAAVDILLVVLVIPFSIILLVATRLRTRDWMLGRTDWRARRRAAGAVLVPLVVLLVAIPFYQVYSVPGGGPGFSVQQYTRPPTEAERATAKMYRKAWNAQRWAKGVSGNFSQLSGEYQSTDDLVIDNKPLSRDQVAWIKANAKTIDLTVRASRQPECFRSDACGRSPHLGPHEVACLGHLVASSAKQLTTDGKLDEALDRYLAALRVSLQLRPHCSFPWPVDRLEARVERGLIGWAAHTEQTPERIKRALDEVARLRSTTPSLDSSIKEEWCSGLAKLVTIVSQPVHRENQQWNEIIQTAALRWFPWEQARARRVLNFLTRENLAIVDEVEKAVAGGQPMGQSLRSFSRKSTMHNIWKGCLYHNVSPHIGRLQVVQRRVQEFVACESRYRAFRLQLALAAWRLEHGEVPATLDQLVGAYLDAVPIDPYTGRPFRYFPKGHPGGAVSTSRIDPDTGRPFRYFAMGHRGSAVATSPNEQPLVVVEKGIGPFLWSPRGIAADLDESLDNFQAMQRHLSRNGRPEYLSEWDLLRSGQIFPVP
ncbi:MAG: hypothetical protein JW888_05470, partial [Pirellulales bacterium]|nr:hypothetical protein [Pirellulales bacterium]